MTTNYYELGRPLPGVDPQLLKSRHAREMLVACTSHDSFELVELRGVDSGGDRLQEIIVVDCVTGGVPPRNKFGIRPRERLALIFTLPNDSPAPQVRMLRQDFPQDLKHLNLVGPGEPAHLCLYFEPAEVIARAYTHQKHLRHVERWLIGTAVDNLHKEDQPAEQLFFQASLRVVVPPDIEQIAADSTRLLVPVQFVPNDSDFHTVVLSAVPTNTLRQQGVSRHHAVLVEVPPIVHGRIEVNPRNLGELEDCLSKHSSSLVEQLRSRLGTWPGKENGLEHDGNARTLFIIRVPIKQRPDGPVERTDTLAFTSAAGCTPAKLGESLGVYFRNPDGRYYAPHGVSLEPTDLWRSHQIHICRYAEKLSHKRAREFSAVKESTARFMGVLAGVGSLGSCLLNTWTRMAWGSWTLIDPDVIESHNLARLAAPDNAIGNKKVDLFATQARNAYQNDYHKMGAIAADASASNADVSTAIENANLLIDATTTLHVPRDLSQRYNVPRSASMFFSPSGKSSILLLEDADQDIRLDALEAQYYRAVLNESFGKDHLKGHFGHLWVGGGCRDASRVMPYDQIQLHAAILAQQTRKAVDEPAPCIRIWVQDESLSVAHHDVEVHKPVRIKTKHWTVVWDAGVESKLKHLRKKHEPNETGGIIVGYADQVLRTIYVVDVLPAPPDSEGDANGFVRGVKGVQDKLKDVRDRTANVVDYIGEWHSHPPGHSARPSVQDGVLLADMAGELERDGHPALMVIVGENEVTAVIGITMQSIVQEVLGNQAK